MGFFEEIALSDKRTYQGRFYKDFGGGKALQWQGFIKPILTGEPFEPLPYPTTLGCSDGLAELAEAPFTNNAGDTITGRIAVSDVLAICFSKTGILFNFRIGVNVYEAGMDSGAGDDPLAQCFVEAGVFTNSDGGPLDCYTVLTWMARLFYARVLQWEGKWWFVRLPELGGSFDYREFDLNGNYVTNGTYNPVLDVDNTDVRFLANGSHLGTEPALSKVLIKQNLQRERDSLIKGFFENRDAEFSDGTVQGFTGFDGWTLVFNGEDGFIKKIPREDDRNWWELSGFDGQAFIKSAFNIEYRASENSGDVIDLRFRYYLQSRAQFAQLTQLTEPAYVKLKWSLRVGSKYVTWDGLWVESVDPIVNEDFVDSFNEERDFSRQFIMPDTNGVLTTESAELRLYSVDGREDVDFISSSEDLAILLLAATPALDLPEGTRKIVSWTNGKLYYYELVATDAAASSPDVINPIDFLSHDKKWFLREVRSLASVSIVDTVRYAEVDVDSFPNGLEPPKEVSYSVPGNPDHLNDFDLPLDIGDLPTTSSFTNGKNIYFNYLTLGDGTPTKEWSRDSHPNENVPLNIILARSIMDQHQVPSRKLRGMISLKGSNQLGFLTVLRFTTYDNRIFLPVSIDPVYIDNEVKVELVELITNPDVGSSFSADFSQDFGGAFDIVVG